MQLRILGNSGYIMSLDGQSHTGMNASINGLGLNCLKSKSPVFMVLTALKGHIELHLMIVVPLILCTTIMNDLSMWYLSIQCSHSSNLLILSSSAQR